jgi:hypothetical protein
MVRHKVSGFGELRNREQKGFRLFLICLLIVGLIMTTYLLNAQIVKIFDVF